MQTKTIDNIRLDPRDEVRFKDMGFVKEIMYAKTRNRNATIKKINKETYMHLETGEIKNFKHMEHRGDDRNEVRRTLGKLKDYINTNVQDAANAKWITLTYAENMQDTERLKLDFRRFIRRARNKYGEYEYIVAMEPQGRGAWHAHLLMIFDRKAPFIPNKEIEKMWQQGFTKTRKLDDIDNIGVYLTAYLGDMALDEFQKLPEKEQDEIIPTIGGIKNCEVDGVSKMIIKGARLYLYPPKFNMYRCSKGIKKPEIEYISEENAQKKVNAATLTFEKTIQLYNSENGFQNILNYRQYNTKR